MNKLATDDMVQWARKIERKLRGRARATSLRTYTDQMAIDDVSAADLVAAIASALSDKHSELRVMALEWHETEADWWVAEPPALGFGYEVRVTDSGRVRTRRGTGEWDYFDGTAGAAKAAAQADFEQIIRSTLAPTSKASVADGLIAAVTATPAQGVTTMSENPAPAASEMAETFAAVFKFEARRYCELHGWVICSEADTIEIQTKHDGIWRLVVQPRELANAQ